MWQMAGPKKVDFQIMKLMIYKDTYEDWMGIVIGILMFSLKSRLEKTSLNLEEKEKRREFLYVNLK